MPHPSSDPGPGRDTDMRVVEDALRTAFARQERLTPAADRVRVAIDETAARRRRRRRATRGLSGGLALMAVLALPVLGRTLVEPPASSVAVPPIPSVATEAAAEPLDFLLIGVDGGDGRRNGLRADSVLIVHVPRDRKRLYLISLPRDLGVDIPHQGFGKLSESFYHGSYRPGARPDVAAGAETTERTVSALTGLRFAGTATMTYAGLRGVTDAVGGVEVCLPQSVRSVHTKRVFAAGCQQLDGTAALDLLRQRFKLPVGAHDRDRNGQRFAKALLRKVTDSGTLTNPIRVAALLQTAGTSVDLDGVTMPDLVGTLRGAAAGEAVGIGWTYRAVAINGVTYERLDPAVSGSLFEAARRDSLGDWVAANPANITPR